MLLDLFSIEYGGVSGGDTHDYPFSSDEIKRYRRSLEKQKIALQVREAEKLAYAEDLRKQLRHKVQEEPIYVAKQTSEEIQSHTEPFLNSTYLRAELEVVENLIEAIREEERVVNLQIIKEKRNRDALTVLLLDMVYPFHN